LILRSPVIRTASPNESSSFFLILVACVCSLPRRAGKAGCKQVQPALCFSLCAISSQPSSPHRADLCVPPHSSNSSRTFAVAAAAAASSCSIFFFLDAAAAAFFLAMHAAMALVRDLK